jgi:hypothetical protein
VVAEELFGFRIDNENAAIRIGDDHGIGRGLEITPELCFLGGNLGRLTRHGFVGLAQIREARQRDSDRSQPDQENGGSNRGRGGYGLDGAGQPVGSVPEVPDFHSVGEAAGHDENSNTYKRPTEGHVIAAPHHAQQGDGNGHVGDKNECVGDQMKPDESGVPLVTITVGYEIAGSEKPFQELHLNSPRN